MLFSVNKEIPLVDAIVSANILSNLNDVIPILKQLNKKMSLGKKIVIMESDKFYDVIRNADWLSDLDQIKMYFKEAGFKVEVDTLQGNAWMYLLIYGVKVKNIK